MIREFVIDYRQTRSYLKASGDRFACIKISNRVIHIRAEVIKFFDESLVYAKLPKTYLSIIRSI